MTKNMAAPCKMCPFTRAIEPGYLGGSEPEKYIGQAHGPFILPCHQACDFDDPEWRGSKLLGTPQCAGAAIFRSNIGVARMMPEALHKLPMDTDKVFASADEFLAHHKRISLYAAHAQLQVITPLHLLRREMESKRAVVYSVPKEPEHG